MVTDVIPQRQKGPIRVTLIMASFGFKQADPDDIDFMTIIAQIEQRNAVIIDVDGDNGWLDIHAYSKDNIAKATDAIRSAMKLEVGGTRVWHPTILLGPVSAGTSGFLAELDLTPDGARPCMSADSTPATDNAEFGKLRAKWLDDFRVRLLQTTNQIRSVPSEMRMRASLGTLLLQEWKKNTTVYTYSELENIVKRLGVRGTFSFSQMLGTAQLARNLLAKIYASPGAFEPVNIRIGKLENIKPKHTLILTTGNLKVETEVIHVRETDSHEEVVRLAIANGHRRERRSRAVEIATSCPEHKYDWNLAVHTRVPVASLPFSHDDIAKHSTFARRADPHEFPDISVRPEFMRAHQVEQITSKTSWVFKLKGSVYAVEVALYRVLATASDRDDAPLKEGGCGVDIFRPGWDEILSSRNVAAGLRELSDNCKELFPFLEKKLTDRDGIEAFARRVAQIRELVSRLDEKTPVRATEEEEVVPRTGEEDLLLSWDA